jgi:cell division protein FtsB
MHQFESVKNPKFSKDRLRSLLGAFLPLGLTAYFIYHAIEGDHGLLAWLRVEESLKISQAELGVLSETHRGLEHRVRLLRPETLDPDMLEERIRWVLNLMNKNEVVVFKKK